MRTTNLPILDFSDFNGDAAARAALIKKIDRAARETGFFYLKNFGIDVKLIAEAFAQSRAFFALPAAEKAELLWDRTNRGYDGLEAQSFNAGQPGDLKESFRFTAEPDMTRWVDAEAAWNFLVNQPNTWPQRLPRFRHVLLSFLSGCGDLVDDILTALEQGLEMAEPALSKSHLRRNYTMRLIRYPGVSSTPKAGQARCGEHTDWGTISCCSRRRGRVGGALPLGNVDSRSTTRRMRPREHRGSIGSVDGRPAGLHPTPGEGRVVTWGCSGPLFDCALLLRGF